MRQGRYSRSSPSADRHPGQRSGLVVIWFLALALMSITVIHFVLEIGWLNLARSELQVAVEGAALAGARSWGPNPLSELNPVDAPALAIARTTAKAYAHSVLSAHTVSGSSTELGNVSMNNNPAAMNNNLACPGTIVFGSSAGGVFSAGTPPPSPDQRAVRVDVTITISSPFGFGSRTINGNATAVWDATQQRARLSHVMAFSCL